MVFLCSRIYKNHLCFSSSGGIVGTYVGFSGSSSTFIHDDWSFMYAHEGQRPFKKVLAGACIAINVSFHMPWSVLKHFIRKQSHLQAYPSISIITSLRRKKGSVHGGL